MKAFVDRHIGPGESETAKMLADVGYNNINDFIAAVVPQSIRDTDHLMLSRFRVALSESDALKRLRGIASKNKVFRSYIGQGYAGTLIPPVIQRNVLENPGWYTQYTPYQPEISQGRLEALLNFQTMICDLTKMEIANASLLDEATAAAEAMTMSHAIKAKDGNEDLGTFFVSDKCYPQTIALVKTRAKVLDIPILVGDAKNLDFKTKCFGLLLQYPDDEGRVENILPIIERAHAAGAIVTVATDLLALALIKPPGELGADMVVGNSQRFGVPLGFGGPHAAFFATRDEHKRLMPGRLIGVSKDVHGNPALRLSLQTREQHIRREKATSNICTAQVLLANMASFYAVYHGPNGIRSIAESVHGKTVALAEALKSEGLRLRAEKFFDTLLVEAMAPEVISIRKRAAEKQINLRWISDSDLAVTIDETVTEADLADLAYVFTGKSQTVKVSAKSAIPADFKRSSSYLTHPIFNSYHSETEFLRYVRKLESRDLSLCQSMIPLGSCTMKLNATAEMFPVSWPEFSALHPFAPREQTLGYQELFADLEKSLAEITGFDEISLQPNSGAQGEYAGLLAIRGYLDGRGEEQRNICLIPKSAHGTNPASAVMAGMQVVVVDCDEQGNVAIGDLEAKAKEHSKDLAALMITYPSTHGVFEEDIKRICQLVHDHGGQVYMDGANLNAQVGLCRPAAIGADVCHINLHKTFCIPHGGGGPGMGPIGVKKHLAAYLPGHSVVAQEGRTETGPVSAAPWGSSSILVISWMYIAMMAGEGLTSATELAILNANYLAARLGKYFPVLYRGKKGTVAHECIFDVRQFKKLGIEVDDIAKRLMDYGFHAPTVSFPVPGTLMVEPTESEPKRELDRFCDAMISIWREIKDIEVGKMDAKNNPLKNAPHTAQAIAADEWDKPYSRKVAAFPSASSLDFKFWPSVGRIDGNYGDRNLICTCPSLDEYR